MQRPDLEILSASETSTGKQGAHVLTLRAAGVVFRAKWRPDSSRTTRNDPRLELGAYAVQKLFLQPSEYVVPPTAVHCFPLAAYRARVDAKAQPTLPGARCISGILSYWLEGVASVMDARKDGWFEGENDHALSLALFGRNPVYRDSIARVNVLTYVIGHRDSHTRNFVIARGGSPVVYSVDNSLSFTMAPNPRILPERDWSKIQVPALPRAIIERLRSASQRVATLANIAVVQRTTIGLTKAEIDGVRQRMLELVARADRGELAVY